MLVYLRLGDRHLDLGRQACPMTDLIGQWFQLPNSCKGGVPHYKVKLTQRSRRGMLHTRTRSIDAPYDNHVY